jgi:hypothetical protein
MSKSIPLLGAALLIGCSIFLPPQIDIFDSPYPQEMVIEAVHDFADEWEEEYDDDIWFALEDISIHFYEKSEKEWNTVGCYRGTTSDQYRINVGYINDVEDWPIYNTAFWHELVHLTFWVIVNDPDIDHEEGRGPWKDHHNELVAKLKTQWRDKYASFEQTTGQP